MTCLEVKNILFPDASYFLFKHFMGKGINFKIATFDQFLLFYDF